MQGLNPPNAHRPRRARVSGLASRGAAASSFPRLSQRTKPQVRRDSTVESQRHIGSTVHSCAAVTRQQRHQPGRQPLDGEEAAAVHCHGCPRAIQMLDELICITARTGFTATTGGGATGATVGRAGNLSTAELFQARPMFAPPSGSPGRAGGSRGATWRRCLVPACRGRSIRAGEATLPRSLETHQLKPGFLQTHMPWI